MKDRNEGDPARRGEAVELVVMEIRRRIAAGRMVPGQRLIARELMDETGYGRGTVREALARLAAEGLLDLTPNQGAAVRRFTRDELKDLFRIRSAIEGLAAGLAAGRIDLDDNRARFAAAVACVEAHRADPQVRFFEANNAFHSAIFEISGNSQIGKVLSGMQVSIIMMQVKHFMGDAEFRHSFDEHLRIAGTILKGDPIAARAAMESHLGRSGQWILSLSDTVFRVRPSTR